MVGMVRWWDGGMVEILVMIRGWDGENVEIVEMVLHTGDNQNAIQCKHLLSDMSMHFSQLKSMKNLVAATNAEKGR